MTTRKLAAKYYEIWRSKFAISTAYLAVQDLFQEEDVDLAAVNKAAPLAARMRPRSLEEFVGQQHILAPGKLLRRAIEADRLPSVILSGPPGTGKTTLAHIIADMTHAKFVRPSGVESNVAETRRALAAAPVTIILDSFNVLVPRSQKQLSKRKQNSDYQPSL